MKIKNKIALVLGAVKGLGKGVGLALAEQGAFLILTRYDWQDSFEQMEKDFAATGAKYDILTCDLCNVDRIQELAEFIKQKYGRLDILINNIERGGWPVVHGQYIERQWNLEIETTLKAKWWIFNTVFPLLQESQDACVINISSVAGMTGRSGAGALVFNDGYAAANRAVFSFTETWARMGAPNIRVNELMLGIFETRHGPNTRGWKEALTEDEKNIILDQILLKRTGRIEEAVNACLFLIRDASYMTGSLLRLDGGFVLGHTQVPPMPEGIL